MIVMTVNGDRYLFNDQVSDKSQDAAAEGILSRYGEDAYVDFDQVRDEDLNKININF